MLDDHSRLYIWNVLNKATIKDIRCIRRACLPAIMEVHIAKDGVNYIVSTKVNFRILCNGESVLVFDDMVLDKKGNELSYRRYCAQKDLEKTLICEELIKVNALFRNKKIYSCVVSSYGDVELNVRRIGKIQFLNTTHYNDYDVLTILRYPKEGGGKPEELLNVVTVDGKDIVVQWSND